MHEIWTNSKRENNNSTIKDITFIVSMVHDTDASSVIRKLLIIIIVFVISEH
jgi:hypothetical protein